MYVSYRDSTPLKRNLASGRHDVFRHSPSRKRPRTDASDSPTNLLRMSLGPTERNAAWASPATALASFVLPQPGGPNKNGVEVSCR